jgi:hypothetical protein
VYEHRNATCTTFFCRFDRGEASYHFWWHGLLPFLRLIEETLSDWAVDELGAGEGFGRDDPRAFYRACRLAVGYLSWTQVRALGGVRLDVLLARVEELHRALLAAPLHPTGLPPRRP